MASSVNFLDILSMLEDTFEFNKDGKRSEYSQETILTFRNLKNYIVGCSWTDNAHYKFIVENKSLSSEELAIKYSALNQGKQKAAATFRVQRAEVCKILSSLFGNNLNEVFFAQKEDELRQIRNKIALFSNGIVDSQKVFPDFIMEEMKKYSTAGQYVDILDCSKEIIVLSKLTTNNIQRELSNLDPDKVAYIFSLLHSDFIRVINGKYIVNQDRIHLLSELNAYVEIQDTKKMSGNNDMVNKLLEQLRDERHKYEILEKKYKKCREESFLQRDAIKKEYINQIAELQRENNDLKKKYTAFRNQAGQLANENGKLKQVVELYSENDTGFEETSFSDDDICDDSFLTGGNE